MSDMKDRFIFEFQRPKDGIFVSAYVHELYNYRYHWHDTDFEVAILLDGKAEYCHGQQTSLLESGDIIIIDPCQWHASFARKQGSRALVIRFSDKAYRTLLKKDERIAFNIPPSDAASRDEDFYRSIRRYCAMFLLSASEKGQRERGLRPWEHSPPGKRRPGSAPKGGAGTDRAGKRGPLPALWNRESTWFKTARSPL